MLPVMAERKASSRPERVPIDSVVLDPNNARLHTEANIALIAASLSAFGQQKPIVVCDGVVIAGNGTVIAARQLGWDEILIVRSDLPPDRARAFALADNRTAELASWDTAALSASLAALDSSLRSAVISDDDYDRLASTAAEWLEPTPVTYSPDANGFPDSTATYEDRKQRTLVLVYAANDHDELVGLLRKYGQAHSCSNNSAALAHLCRKEAARL